MIESTDIQYLYETRRYKNGYKNLPLGTGKKNLSMTYVLMGEYLLYPIRTWPIVIPI
jgi:hypothetical protein